MLYKFSNSLFRSVKSTPSFGSTFPSRVAIQPFYFQNLKNWSPFNLHFRMELSTEPKLEFSEAKEEELKAVKQNLAKIKNNIKQVVEKNKLQEPRLVAVSKTKPASLVKACYEEGHRDFGENYVQELIDKSKLLPSDIKWHYIGHLQSNKCKSLLESVSNLELIETVDSLKLAKTLNKHCTEFKKTVKIFVQVNTSGESSKSGIPPSDVVKFVESVNKEFPNLKFSGLMTIGNPDSPSESNPDFKCLVECKKNVCSKLDIDASKVELSMGMSHDYENAIVAGSTNVRVGSSIFGARDYTKK